MTVSTVETNAPRNIHYADSAAPEPSAAASAAPGDLAVCEPEWPLAATIAPWKIAPDHSGRLTKIFAMSGHVSQYRYGTGHDTSEWPPGWQKGLVTSPESGRIVLDEDDPEFAEFMRQCGIPPSPVVVLTGRPGGRQYHYDGRGVPFGWWPVQGCIYNSAREQIGDIKSRGFVPLPGSVHPNGTVYRPAPGAGSEPPPWYAEYTGAIQAWRHEHPGPCSGGGGSYDRGGGGSGRNDALLAFKKELFYQRGLDEDDPELHRLVLERNQQFAVPLDEREVWATVLRIKGYKRRWTLGVMPGGGGDEYEGRLSVAERQRQGVAGPGSHSPAAEGDVPADPGAGRETDLYAAPPLTRDSHLSTRKEEDPRSSDREVRIAGQEGCKRVRKSLGRLKRQLRAIDPAALWPGRDGALAGTRALHMHILDLGIEQGTCTVTWSAERAASATGAGVSTVYRYLARLIHHGQVRRGGEGQLVINVAPGALRPRRKKAGETVSRDEATGLVRKVMRSVVDKPRKISQRELATQAESQAWLDSGNITGPRRRVTVHRVRQALAELARLGEFTCTFPAIPEKEGERWRSDPATWAPGRVEVPEAVRALFRRPRGRRLGAFERAYIEMAGCGECNPADLREAA